MKKFSRIIALLFSLVLVVSAFTVVALANEETELTPVLCHSLDFEDEEVGVYSNGRNAKTKTPKHGIWETYAADNGNKYIVAKDIDEEGAENGDNKDHTVSGSEAYDISKYPIFAFDFDIMSNDGTYYSSATIRTDLYGGENSSSRISQMGGMKVNAIGLPDEAYVWNHVTIIVDYVGDGIFNFYYYVNGKLTNDDKNFDYSENWSTYFDEDGNSIYNNVRIGVVSMYPAYSDTGHITNEIAYDNFKFSYYPEGYTVEDVATYIYNEDYEMPYGITEASVGETFYDDVNEALAAAADGDTVKLRTNLPGTTIVNKAITIDSNKYDESGTATGEFYEVTLKSTAGYVITVENGVYTATKSDKSVTVVFDPECADENCKCYEGIGHKQNFSSIVPVGQIPEFLTELTPVNDEGIIAEFLGWSYENDGTVDTLVPVTDAQAEAGTLNIYPVYDAETYDGILLNGKDGSKTYFKGHKGFESAMATLISQSTWPGYVSTITLYNDIEYYKSFTFKRYIDLTIDLNGNTLTRVNVFGTANNYNAETSSYDQTTTTSKVNAFVVPRDVKFTITSSKPGAAFKTISVEGTAYYDAEGFLESYTAASETSVKSAGLFAGKDAPMYSRLNLENIDIYSEMLLTTAHKSIKDFGFTMTKCRFYKTVGQEAAAYNKTAGDYHRGGIFLSADGADVNITLTDSLFYIPDASVKASNQYYQLLVITGKGTITATLDNCDIIVSNNNGYNLSADSANNTITLNNCRTYGIKSYKTDFPVILSGSNLTTSYMTADADWDEGLLLVDKEKGISYSLPSISRVTIDSQTALPVFEFGFEDRVITFDKAVKPYAEVYVTVTWLDENGNELSSDDQLRETVAEAPYYSVSTGDGWTGVVVKDWLDEEGNEASLLLADKESYTFKANPVIDEDSLYVGYVTCAQFNIVYYTQFHTALYFPVDEAVSVSSVSGFTPASIVKIDGKAYHSFTKPNTTQGAAEDHEATVTFTFNGTEYTDVIVTNALLYAEEVLTSEESHATEKAAVANMVRYLKEARVMLSLEVSDKFDELIALGAVEELGAKEDYADASVDVSPIADYVDSIGFMADGAFASYVITLTDSAVAAGAEISVTYVGSDEKLSLVDATLKANSKFTNLTRVNDLAKAIEITVTVPAAEEGAEATTVSATYSAKAYINATDSALVKAMYEFGVAVAAYREYLMTL